jgi:hypothetical protein
MRASCAVQRQSTRPGAVFRWRSQAVPSWGQGVGAGSRRAQHCVARTLSAVSAIFPQLPCLGGNAAPDAPSRAGRPLGQRLPTGPPLCGGGGGPGAARAAPRADIGPRPTLGAAGRHPPRAAARSPGRAVARPMGRLPCTGAPGPGVRPPNRHMLAAPEGPAGAHGCPPPVADGPPPAPPVGAGDCTGACPPPARLPAPRQTRRWPAGGAPIAFGATVCAHFFARAPAPLRPARVNEGQGPQRGSQSLAGPPDPAGRGRTASDGQQLGRRAPLPFAILPPGRGLARHRRGQALCAPSLAPPMARGGARGHGVCLSASVQRRALASTSAVSKLRAWSRCTAAAYPVFTRASTCSRSSGGRRTTYLTMSTLLCERIPTRRAERRERGQ